MVPVSLTSTTITGTVAATQSGTWNVTNISGTVSLPTGAATETTLAALNTKTPALGQAVMASSQPVVIASNQSAITVTVGSNSLVSTVNSTAVNLGVGAVFTGTSEDVSEYSMINATVFSSHASATDGLSLQQSSDGTNWDMVDAYTIPAATGKTFSIAVNAKFYRLVYTNGATLTTSLRIQTIHSKSPKKGSSMRPQDARTNDNDMEEMASYNSLFNGTSWDRARGTIANGQAVDVTRMPSASTTYSAAIVGLASAITATDIFTITGSATKTVRVTRIVVNGVQTTAAQVNVLIIKRSTANTAGTSTAPTRVSYDSTNAAATATVLAYTANPTLGTAVGTGSARRAFIPGAATASDAQGLEIVSGDVGQQQMTLRGLAEVLAINLNSTTVAGSAFNITVEWTES